MLFSKVRPTVIAYTDGCLTRAPVIAGTNMLNNQPVAIKFVCDAMSLAEPLSAVFDRDNVCRNPASLKPHSCETSTGHTGR